MAKSLYVFCVFTLVDNNSSNYVVINPIIIIIAK